LVNKSNWNCYFHAVMLWIVSCVRQERKYQHCKTWSGDSQDYSLLEWDIM
jgi:hypothetical protein